jgi:hypothetical protein
MIMKNIKSIALSVFCMCAAICAQAQIETKKPVGSPIPQVSLPPVQAPEMKNAPKPVTYTEAVAETPSPLTRDKNQQQPEEKAKLKLVLVDEKEVATPGGEEGRKIMEGKTNQPAPEINNQSTVDPKPAPQFKTPKPVNGRQQQ